MHNIYKGRTNRKNANCNKSIIYALLLCEFLRVISEIPNIPFDIINLESTGTTELHGMARKVEVDLN
jgi:hypothetical protein